DPRLAPVQEIELLRDAEARPNLPHYAVIGCSVDAPRLAAGRECFHPRGSPAFQTVEKLVVGRHGAVAAGVEHLAVHLYVLDAGALQAELLGREQGPRGLNADVLQESIAGGIRRWRVGSRIGDGRQLVAATRRRDVVES